MAYAARVAGVIDAGDKVGSGGAQAQYKIFVLLFGKKGCFLEAYNVIFMALVSADVTFTIAVSADYAGSVGEGENHFGFIEFGNTPQHFAHGLYMILPQLL